MKKAKSNSSAWTDYIYYLPILICMGIVPLIVKASFNTNPLIDNAWYLQDEVIVDFFLYYKGILLVITAVIMVLLSVYYYKKERTICFYKEDLIMLPLIVLTAFELISTLFSINHEVSIKGMPDQYETIWVMLAYSICCVYAYYFLSRNEINIEIITNIILFSVFPVALICVGQFFKIDIYRYIYSGEGYEFSFSLGNVYGPFYNINYVGSYVTLVLPFILAVTFFSKTIWKKIVALLISVMLLISIYGSYSSTGLIALAAIICLGILLLILKCIPSVQIRPIVFWMSIGAILFTGLVVGKDFIRNYLLASDTEIDDFQYVITNTDDVEFGYKDQVYSISMPHDESIGYYISLKNENGDLAMHAETDDVGTYYIADDDNLSDLKIRPVSFSEDPAVYGIELISNDFSLYFSNQVMDSESYYFWSPTGAWTSLSEENQSKSFAPLENLSGFANGRGYIWNKTIALISQYILFGSGADTFACAYPNNDYIGNMNNGYYHLVMTKPHNLYLQYAIQSGLISLICLLILFGWYFFKALNVLLTEPFDSIEKKINFALFLGLTGYMITGIANDSTVTVAPVFWTFLGLGIALTNRIKTTASH